MKILGYDVSVKRQQKQLPYQQSRYDTINGVSAAFTTGQTFKQIVQQGIYANGAVQGCIASYSMTLNEARLVVKTNGTEQPQHPLQKILDRPNEAMSQSELLAFVATYMAAGGNVYLVKVRNSAGGVLGLYPYHDGQIHPVPSRWEWIDHYEHTVDGVPTPIDRRDVIQIKSHIIDPLKPHVGMSLILAAARGVDIYSEMERTIYSILKNDAMPKGVLSYPPGTTLNQETKDTLREMIGENHGGTNKGRLMVLSDGARYERMSFDLKELMADNIISKAEISICQAFRVHPLVAMTYAGLTSSTYSNMEEAFKQFTELTRVPIWTSWQQSLTRGFEGEFPGTTIEFDLSKVAALLPKAGEVQKQTVEEYKAGVITQNEARKRLGYDERPGGDTFAVPAPALAIQPAKSYKASPEPDDYEPMDVDTTTDYMGNEINEELETKILDRNQAAMIDAEQAIAAALAKQIAALEEVVVGAYKARGAASIKGDPFNTEDWRKKFLAGTEKERMDLVRKMIGYALSDIGMSVDDLTGTDFDAILKIASLESSEKIAESIGTIRDEVREIIVKNANTSASELTQILRAKFETLKASRAALIGQTTATSTSGAAQRSTWSKMNDRITEPKRKIARIWVTRGDGNVRPAHRALNRVPESKAGTWNLNGNNVRYPADSAAGASQACNCRCTTMPVRIGRIN